MNYLTINLKFKIMAEIANGNNLDKNKGGKAHLKSSTFPIKQEIKMTYPFGIIGVNMKFNGISNDRVSVRNVADVRSYTIATPLMDSIFMNKTFIQVPRMAILPFNWEKLYRQPAIGEDIDQETYGTSVQTESWNTFINKLISQKQFLGDNIITAKETMPKEQFRVFFSYYVKTLFLLELIFSKGSLLNQLGAKLWRTYLRATGMEIDDEVESFVNSNIGGLYVKLNNKYVWVMFPKMQAKPDTWPSSQTIKINEFLWEIRDNTQFEIEEVCDLNGNELTVSEAVDVINWRTTNGGYNYNKPMDIAKLWAYHIICAEYFTNDKVDYIYTAELYRQYIYSIERKLRGDIGFELNGTRYTADYLSAAYFKVFARDYTYTDDFENENYWAYWYELFKFHRSLKFKDYFTGARTRPLAIGDTSIPVQAGNTVDVVDVTKNIQWQRFLNVVEKIPQNLAGYTRGIMGTNVAPDYHNPIFLGTTTEQVYGQETENTGEAQQTKQNSVTTNLKNGSSKYQFGFKLDRDSIIIGVVWWDIERNYTMGVERNFMHVDRLDRFNPYMQYTGDQQIYAQELDASLDNENFGYTGSYMEFKQEVAEAGGGFATKALAGWSFTDFYSETGGKTWETPHITPEFIRSKPTELDNFFISLSGHSLGNYFHFIVRNINFIKATRPMAVNPGILG